VYLLSLLFYFLEEKLNPYAFTRSSGFLTDRAIRLISWAIPITAVLSLIIILIKRKMG